MDLIQRSSVIKSEAGQNLNEAALDADIDHDFSTNMRSCWKFLIYFALPFLLAILAAACWIETDILLHF